MAEASGHIEMSKQENPLQYKPNLDSMQVQDD